MVGELRDVRGAVKGMGLSEDVTVHLLTEPGVVVVGESPFRPFDIEKPWAVDKFVDHPRWQQITVHRSVPGNEESQPEVTQPAQCEGAVNGLREA